MLINNSKTISPEHTPDSQPKSDSPVLPFFLAVLTGLFLSMIVLPGMLPSLFDSMTGTNPKVFWYLSRATAVLAYLLLCLSMAMGLMLKGRLANNLGGTALTSDLHQFVSFLGLGFSLIHGLLLMGDSYIAFTFAQVLAPFASTKYLQFWVGLGQLSFYLWGLVIFSYYIRRKTGKKVWTSIHFISYGVFILALVHGLTSGTDAGQGWTFYMYWTSAGLLLFLTIYRILVGLFGLAKAPRTSRE